MATFSLNKPCTGLVCQYVVHTVRFEGQRRAKVRKFTEAWTVRDGKVSPAGGRDYFLLPTTFRTRAGCCSIRAFAWFLPCDPTKVLTELDTLQGDEKRKVEALLDICHHDGDLLMAVAIQFLYATAGVSSVLLGSKSLQVRC